MLLSKLLQTEENLLSQIQKGVNTEIKNIVSNSKEVEPGSLFVAIKGLTVDAADFTPQIIKDGTRTIIYHREADLSKYDIPENVIVLKNSGNQMELLGRLLSRFYPEKPNNIIGITGTNGKTSTVGIIRQLIKQLGRNSASVGTLGLNYNINGEDFHPKRKGTVTAPEIVDLYKYLAFLKNNGIEDVAMEVTSQGMEQGRSSGITVNIGVFTNFSPNHLETHKTVENYFSSKMILFNKLMGEGSVAVLNADIPEYQTISEICKQRNHQVLSYGKKGQDVKLINTKANSSGQKITLEIFGRTYSFNTGLIGNFQAMNIASALTVLTASGYLNEENVNQLDFEFLEPAKGRIELVARHPKNGARIYIDSAHNPASITNLLKMFKESQEQAGGGKLIVVSGAGGDRDPSKRPIMGKIICEFADIAIITEDNPRNEDAAKIRKDILVGCNEKAIEASTRKEAIEYGISQLTSENDILVLIGKGHEEYIIWEHGRIEPFNEGQIVRDYLKTLSEL